MTASVEPSSSLVDAYAQLESLFDEIAAGSSQSCSEAELVELAEQHERLYRRMAYFGHQRVMDVSDRDAHRSAGCSSVQDFMSRRLRITDTRRRMDAMAALMTTYTLQGQLKDPECPDTAAALAEGAIAPDHVSAVLDVMKKLPAAVSAEDRAAAESTLAEYARELTPKSIRQVGARILAHLDPDGSLSDERDRKRRRRLSVLDPDSQQMSKIVGHLDPETRAMLDVVMAAWAAPGMNNPDDDQSPIGHVDEADPERVKEAAQRDSRGAAERQHDAFKALLRCALDGGVLGKSHRGLPPHLIIKITESELRERAGLGHTTTGADLPISDVITLAAESQMYLAVFADHTNEPLYLGRAKRLANQAQRFISFVQYGGCSVPGCPRPFSHTEMHHAEQDWTDGGRTDANTLAPACPPHNRLVGPKVGQLSTIKIRTGPDRGRYGWTRNTTDGVPPDKPVTNHIHLVDELVARRRGSPGLRQPPTTTSRAELALRQVLTHPRTAHPDLIFRSVDILAEQ